MLDLNFQIPQLQLNRCQGPRVTSFYYLNSTKHFSISLLEKRKKKEKQPHPRRDKNFVSLGSAQCDIPTPTPRPLPHSTVWLRGCSDEHHQSTEQPSRSHRAAPGLEQPGLVFKSETIAHTRSINHFQCVSNMQKAQKAAKASDSAHIQITPAFVGFISVLFMLI